jgi:membrane-associated phospholipid phosphatase
MPLSERFRQEMDNMWTDNKNYYTWPTLRNLALGVAGAGILANTSLDQDFRDWYQTDVRGRSLNEFSGIARRLGDGHITIPAVIAVGFVGALHDDTRWGSGLAEFSARTGRAFGVGTPTLLLLQYGLGSTRPAWSEEGSYWKPFDHSHGASGHAFMGAVPFLSGAQMTDDPYLKGLLYFCSAIPAWSRVNDDMHYLSQAWLGWWIAYLSCDAVNATQHKDDRLLVSPIATPEMVGASVMYRY